MDNFITTHEATIRLGIFFGVFALMAAWELLAPRRVLALAVIATIAFASRILLRMRRKQT